jgi:hypothetical protein
MMRHWDELGTREHVNKTGEGCGGEFEYDSAQHGIVVPADIRQVIITSHDASWDLLYTGLWN